MESNEDLILRLFPIYGSTLRIYKAVLEARPGLTKGELNRALKSLVAKGRLTKETLSFGPCLQTVYSPT